MEGYPVYTYAKWQIKEGQPDTVLKLLGEVVNESRKEPGNLFYKVLRSNSDGNTLVLFEAYKDRDALDAHRNSVHFQAIVVAQIIPLLENREVFIATEMF